MRAKYFWNSFCDGLHIEAYHTEIYRRILSCLYPCTDVTILCKNLTKALMYVYTTLFTLLHCYTFQPSRSADTFQEPGQQNTYPGVNIKLKNSVLKDTLFAAD
jgi:hypothetical protein